MKRIYPIILLTFLIASYFPNPCQAQKNKKIKFGQVDKEDFKADTYEQSVSEEAYYQFDYGEVWVEFDQVQNSVNSVFKRHFRIKILKKEGLEYADIVIPLYDYERDRRLEFVKKIQANTYNLVNGEVVATKWDKSNQFSERRNEFYTILKIPLTQVKEGSIIEVKYSTALNNIYTLKSWEFQKEIPVKWSELVYTMPNGLKFNSTFRGYESPILNDVKGYTSRIIYEKVPAIKTEPFISTLDNYTSRVDFELNSINYNGRIINFTNSWSGVEDRLRIDEEFGGRLFLGGNFLKEPIARIETKANTEEEKAQMAYEIVQNHMQYKETLFPFALKPLHISWKSGIGNSADINLSLVHFLRKLGLDANPVLLSTRDNGWVQESEVNLTKFNYVIAQVRINNKDVLLDATEKLIPFAHLPDRALNYLARVFEKKSSRWVSIANDELHATTTMLNYSIKPDGSALIRYTKLSKDRAAISKRELMGKNPSDKKIIDNINNRYSDIEVESINYDSPENLNEPIKEKYDLMAKNQIEFIGEIVTFNPFLMEASQFENPFKIEQRSYPVEFISPSAEKHVLNIEIPEGYAIESLPESIKFVLPDGSAEFKYQISSAENRVSLKSSTKINRTTFLQGEYPALKKFFEQVESKTSELVTLKKNLIHLYVEIYF